MEDKKIEILTQLQEMIDRLATKSYGLLADPANIKKNNEEKKITWGEYFQIQITRNHSQKAASEFTRVVQTIMFDIIASILIFTDKPPQFFRQVAEDKRLALAKDYDDWTILEQDALHLDILRSYFEEMGLNIEKLDSQDFTFFQEFSKLSRAS